MDLRELSTSGGARLGLGTLTWGRDIEARLAGKLFGTFVAGGGRFIDTASSYGGGAAEQILGQLLRPSAREQVFVATKAGLRTTPDGPRLDTRKNALLAELQGSLRRLRLDYVDLWQVHAWGEAPLEETLAAFDQAVASGLARSVGLSNFVGWQTAQAVTWQRAFQHAPISSVQVEYSLLARRAELEILPAAQEYGLACFPWSPLGRGVLNGGYLAGIPAKSRGSLAHFADFVQPYLGPDSTRIVQGLVLAAEGLGLTPGQVAWLWVRDAPGVTVPISGARTVAQLTELLEVTDTALPAEIVSALDDISGGPAPGRRTATAETTATS